MSQIMRVDALEKKDRLLSDLVAISDRFPRLLRFSFGKLNKRLAPLVVSATISELASNVLYVALLEKAYELGDPATGVGGVLILQSALQMTLGSVAGSMVGRIGTRKSGIIGLLSQAIFAFGLAWSRSIGAVYLLGSLIMIARLLIVPSWLTILPSVSTRANLAKSTSLLYVIRGSCFFLGPALAAGLFLSFKETFVPAAAAGLMLIVAVLPSWIVPSGSPHGRPDHMMVLWAELKSSWRFIGRHRPVWQVFVCLTISIMTLGAVMPLLTPLARQVGLGLEGTGVFVSALGLGALIGPFLAGWFFRRVSLSTALLLTGLLTPLGIGSTSILESVEGIFIGLMTSALAGASLNVIVITILQRVTPASKRGSILGAEQTFLGLGWLVSLVAVTSLVSVGMPEPKPTELFLMIGMIGAVMVLGCWLPNQTRLRLAFKIDKPMAI